MYNIEMFEKRAKDLVSKMTLEEKVAQMKYDAPAIERLGVPAYNWWNECLHGVGVREVPLFFLRLLVWRQALILNL